MPPSHLGGYGRAEGRRRKEATNPERPVARVVLHGATRDQSTGRHEADHADITCAPDAATATAAG